MHFIYFQRCMRAADAIDTNSGEVSVKTEQSGENNDICEMPPRTAGTNTAACSALLSSFNTI